MDDDPYVSCPYNKIHRVPRSRLQGHISKCYKVYPELKICPYNATHRLPESEMRDHLKICETKKKVCIEKTKQDLKNALRWRWIPNRLSVPELDPNHEYWDD